MATIYGVIESCGPRNDSGHYRVVVRWAPEAFEAAPDLHRSTWLATKRMAAGTPVRTDPFDQFVYPDDAAKRLQIQRGLQVAAKMALDVQNASNLSGVVQAFANTIMPALWEASNEGGHGTDWVNRHPIAVLFADKIAHLTGTQTLGHDVVLNAYPEVRRLAEGWKYAKGPSESVNFEIGPWAAAKLAGLEGQNPNNTREGRCYTSAVRAAQIIDLIEREAKDDGILQNLAHSIRQSLGGVL